MQPRALQEPKTWIMQTLLFMPIFEKENWWYKNFKSSQDVENDSMPLKSAEYDSIQFNSIQINSIKLI